MNEDIRLLGEAYLNIREDVVSKIDLLISRIKNAITRHPEDVDLFIRLYDAIRLSVGHDESEAKEKLNALSSEFDPKYFKWLMLSVRSMKKEDFINAPEGEQLKQSALADREARSQRQKEPSGRRDNWPTDPDERERWARYGGNPAERPWGLGT